MSRVRERSRIYDHLAGAVLYLYLIAMAYYYYGSAMWVCGYRGGGKSHSVYTGTGCPEKAEHTAHIKQKKVKRLSLSSSLT